ncbi:MAG: FAD:protein FMN transferase [Tissierellia bacterium]|nr:FAD:protein FMN transferase [Tissierellia bacterium]
MMKLTKFRILLIILALVSIIITGCNNDNNKSKSNDQPLSRTEFMMDTILTLKIYDKKDNKILDEAFSRLEEIEKRMSSTIEDSDVSLINKNAGIEPVQVHDDVYYVIEQAKHYASLSNRAFDPTIGPLVDLWNISGDEEQTRDSIPTDEEIKSALALINSDDLELLEDNKVFLKRKGMKLELGGIVKGYAADEVKRIFKENGVESAIIDLGGNIYAMGKKLDGSPWNIGITNPYNPAASFVGILKAQDKSIVTSGDYERYFIYKGKRYHHIIDTNTGYPTENQVTSVSIISDKSIDGDALSTTLFVLGVEEGLNLIDQLDGIEAIFITKDKKVIPSAGIKDHFTLSNEEFKLENQ